MSIRVSVNSSPGSARVSANTSPHSIRVSQVGPQGSSFTITRSDLKALVGSTGTYYHLNDGTKSGIFYWSSDDNSAAVEVDTLEGWFIAPNTDSTGASGAWIREESEGTFAHHAGAVEGSGQTSAQWTVNRNAIQAAVDMVTYGHRNCGVSSVDTGWWEFYGTIHLGYGASFTVSRLYGSGHNNRGHSLPGNGTVLAHMGPDTSPAINIQGGRDSEVKDMSIIGIYDDAFAALGDGTSETATLQATWDAVGGSGQHNPYAAITVDAYSGVAPADKYDDVVYPSWTGITTQYDLAYTSNPCFERVSVAGFNTAFCIHPCNDNSQGDFANFTHISFSNCMWGISVGNTQSRNVTVTNCQAFGCWCAFTNDQHGPQQGKFDGPIINFSGVRLQNVFSFSDAFTLGVPTFINAYAENLFKLGSYVSATTSDLHMRFVDCTFTFAWQNGGTFGTPASIITGPCNGYIIFDGGSIRTFPKVLDFGVTCIFNGTFIRSDQGSPLELYEAHGMNALCGGVAQEAATIAGKGPITFRQYNVDTGAGRVTVGGPGSPGGSFANTDRTRCIPSYVTFAGHSAEDPGQSFYVPYATNTLNLSTLSAVSLTTDKNELSFTLSATSEPSLLFYGPLTGDVVRHAESGSVFFVNSRTSNTVTARLQNNITATGSSHYTAIPLTSGDLDILNGRFYSPSRRMFGDVTTGSAVISNVSAGDGSFSIIDEISVGDAWVTEFNGQVAYFPRAKAIVTAKDSTVGTITLSSFSAYTDTRVPLEMWVRTGPANSTLP